MARLNISHLSLPSREFDPEFAPRDTKGKKRFELTADANAEETLRVKLLGRQLRKRSDLLNNREIERLRKRLGTGRARPTLASACYLHDQRRRIVGALWKLVRDED